MKQYTFLFIIAAIACASAQPPQEPNWPLKVVTWDLNKAYPGIMYDHRLGVIGGTFPYTFQLQAGPAGMSVHANTGTIAWVAPGVESSGNQVRILVTDSKNRTLTHEYSIDVTKTGFYFVATNGNDAANGTFETPWKTFSHMRSATTKGHMVYFRAGTYTTGGVNIQIDANEAHVWMSYPGEHAILDRGIMAATADELFAQISDTQADGNFLFQDIEIANVGTKAFRVWGLKNAIFRKVNIHGVNSIGANNPGFVMFTDAGSNRPADGHIQHHRVVFQDNKIHGLRSDVGHAAGIVAYNVTNLLFEDNEIYDVDGNGINDKDDGYYNTIRNNIIHDTKTGVILLNQYTQEYIDVSHNLVYNVSSGQGIIVGYQPGYIKDIFVHHNTLVDNYLYFRWVIGEPNSENFNVYNNLIVANDVYPYCSENDGVIVPLTGAEGKFDRNLLWNTGSQAPNIIGSRWGGDNGPYTLAEWQGLGNDLNSVYADPQLDANYALPSGSPFAGIYGSGKTKLDATGIEVPGETALRIWPADNMGQRISGVYDIRGRLLWRASIGRRQSHATVIQYIVPERALGPGPKVQATRIHQ